MLASMLTLSIAMRRSMAHEVRKRLKLHTITVATSAADLHPSTTEIDRVGMGAAGVVHPEV